MVGSGWPDRFHWGDVHVDARMKGRLQRYFMNAPEFLWGLTRENQSVSYPWLRSKGRGLWGESFDFEDGPYDDVKAQLLHNPGIERLVRDFVIPEVKTQYGEEALGYLRNCWRSGTPPDEYILRRLNVHNWGPFFQTESIGGKLFMGPWDIFAGLWFEDFEQLDT